MLINLTLRGFIQKEIKQAFRDPRMKLLLFVVPIIQLIIFGTAISTEIKNIKLYLNAKPSDSKAHELYQRAIASNWFLPSMDLKSSDVILYTPIGGTTQTMTQMGSHPSLQLIIDGTNNLRAQSSERYLEAISKYVIPPQNSMPLDFSIRVLYNPSMESSLFMVPGVMCMIVCVLSIILTSMSICKEKELGTFEMMIATPAKRWEIIAGKTIPYFLLGLSNIPLILIAGVVLFGVPIKGSLIALSLSSIVFVASIVNVGVLISTFAHNQQQGMLGGFIFLFPAIMLSGVMFPLENMPQILQIVSYLNPLRYFVSLLRNILLKGGEWDFVVFNISMIFILGAIIMCTAISRFKKTLS